MRVLNPDAVEWVVVHTADYAGDADVEEVRRWHLARGWDDIGYHFYVRRDGTIQTGRDTHYAGAHVAGINSRSIGICCEGHGDTEPHTEAQRDALLAMCFAMLQHYHLSPLSVIGHREVNDLIDAGLVADRWRTPKTCPGEMVDMDEVRESLWPPPPRIDRLAGPGPAEYLGEWDRAA